MPTSAIASRTAGLMVSAVRTQPSGPRRGRRPEVLTTDAVQASDVVITMGCGDVCPVFPGKRYEDWALDDPAGQGIEPVRTIRDQIRGRVLRLLDELGVEPVSAGS